ncbi:unnamed protein product [Urochloa humidicola]
MPTLAVAWSRGDGDAGDGCARRSEEESSDFPAQGQTIQATRRRCSKETTKGSNSLMKTMRKRRSDMKSTMRSWTWSAAVRKQRRRRPTGGTTAARRGEAAATLHAQEEGAHGEDERHESRWITHIRLIRPNTRETRRRWTKSMEASRSVEAKTSRRRTTCGRSGEVGGGTRKCPQGAGHLAIRTIVEEEEAGEVNANVEVVARVDRRWATQSRSVIE